MKHLLAVGCGLALLAGGCLEGRSFVRAADLPTYKSPAALPAEAPFDWTGFYLGGYGGGALGASAQGYSVSSAWLSDNLPSLIPFTEAAGSQNLNSHGADIGAEAGYDWKVANGFVLGLAGDLEWTNLTGHAMSSGTLPVVAFPYIISERLRADWLGSLRLRAGYTPLNNLLVYATGGVAFGRFDYATSFWDQLLPPFMPGNETEYSNFHGVRSGWTLGAGAQWRLSQNWSISGEFRHSEYGAVTGTGFLQLQQPVSTTYIGHSTGTIRVNSLRCGIEYHFN